MRKNLLRLLALMLTLTIALSLVACSQNTSTNETQNSELNTQSQLTETVQQSEENPMVRMYVPVLQTTTWEEFGETHTTYNRYYYPSEWFREESFTVRVYRENEDGEEQLYYEESYEDHMSTRIRYEDDVETKTIYMYDHDGQTVVLQSIYPSPLYVRTSGDTGYHTYTSYYIYDTQNRKIALRYIWVSESGETDEETTQYLIEKTETGYSRREDDSENTYSIYEYNDSNELLFYYHYFYGEIIYSQEYFYNEDGTLVRWISKHRSGSCSQQGVVSYGEWQESISETQYEIVEVPLSVARRFCMFKWEYID